MKGRSHGHEDICASAQNIDNQTIGSSERRIFVEFDTLFSLSLRGIRCVVGDGQKKVITSLGRPPPHYHPRPHAGDPQRPHFRPG